MKAVQTVAPSELVVADVPEPAEDAQVLIRPQLVGVCGTDVKVYTGAIPVTYPRVMGHEMVGEVMSVPAGSHLSPGTRVLLDPALACGHCDLCRQGRPHLCRNAGLMGREVDGVFAEYVRAPQNALLHVPESISDVAAGVLQVLGTVVHAQRTVSVFPGQVAAVIGLGVAGQLMVQLLGERGVTVVGITRSDWKLDLAARMGAAAVATPDRAESVLAELTDGRGPDLVVEAVGTEQTLARAIELATVGGEILVFGTLTGGNQGLPYYLLYFKELTLYNPRAALLRDYALGIELTAAGRLQLEPIVSHQLTLDDAAEAFELVNDPASMKVLMRVS
ncbi:MAG: alcohol dehydrogenase catalytic domain-containing protein [Acidimicrobiia bacterium]|nr:alcohol dehydrogenase catalytic domain-containing protein [Acidimicrobiia bacterium]MDH3397269.1 alcohol dehydrogenase catalytic domain-containing protein [Acidimicrobiia bacterium]